MVRGSNKDPDSLSRRPSAIRARLRKSAQPFERDLEMLNQESGYKPVSEWDLEELSKGRPKNPNGSFRGGPAPRWLTSKIMVEIKTRLREEASFALSSQLGAALDCVKKIIDSEDVDDTGRPIVDAKTKLDAAKFIIEHTVGKAKALIEVDTTESYREFLAGALVLPSGASAHPVVEGTVLYESEVDDGDDE